MGLSLLALYSKFHFTERKMRVVLGVDWPWGGVRQTSPPPVHNRVRWAWTGGLHYRKTLRWTPLPGKGRSGWGPVPLPYPVLHIWSFCE